VPPRANLFEVFVTALFAWCAQKGALLLRFSTTSDGQPEEFLDVFARRMYLSPLRGFRREMEFPRRFSAQGKIRTGGKVLRWNTTRFLISA